MSVVINGIEMPINCTHCPCSSDETRFCNAANKYIPMLGKPKFCPLATIEERKTGRWAWSEADASWCCAACGCVFEEIEWKPEYNYCPNCGADMRGEGHE